MIDPKPYAEEALPCDCKPVAPRTGHWAAVERDGAWHWKGCVSLRRPAVERAMKRYAAVCLKIASAGYDGIGAVPRQNVSGLLLGLARQLEGEADE